MHKRAIEKSKSKESIEKRNKSYTNRKEACQKGVQTKRKLYGEKLEGIISKTFETSKIKYGDNFREVWNEKAIETKSMTYLCN